MESNLEQSTAMLTSNESSAWSAKMCTVSRNLRYKCFICEYTENVLEEEVENVEIIIEDLKEIAQEI